MHGNSAKTITMFLANLLGGCLLPADETESGAAAARPREADGANAPACREGYTPIGVYTRNFCGYSETPEYSIEQDADPTCAERRISLVGEDGLIVWGIEVTQTCRFIARTDTPQITYQGGWCPDRDGRRTANAYQCPKFSAFQFFETTQHWTSEHTERACEREELDCTDDLANARATFRDYPTAIRPPNDVVYVDGQCCLENVGNQPPPNWFPDREEEESSEDQEPEENPAD